MSPRPRSHRSRLSRARLPVVVLVLGALLLNGCGTPWSRDRITCLAQAPRNAGDYWVVFNSRAVWSGADGAFPLTLPDGRVLWFFGDTFVDGLDATGWPHHGMVRNSMIEQKGKCFTMLTYGGFGTRTSALPAANKDEFLWPNTAIIDGNGLIRITALRVKTVPGPQGWNWEVKGLDIVTITQSLAWVSTVHAPVTQDGAVTWGGGAIKSGGYVYLYGFRKDHQVVARTTPAKIGTDPWEFYTPNGWTKNREAATSPPIDHAPAAMFWVIPHKGGFLASSKKAEMDSDDVSTWWSLSPIGPWKYIGRAAFTNGAGTPYRTYAGRVVNLPGAGLTTLWSQNARKGGKGFNYNNFGPLLIAPMAGSIP